MLGLDAADGTPVLDLKPYLPYADALPDAASGWATGALATSASKITSSVANEPAGREVQVCVMA